MIFPIPAGEFPYRGRDWRIKKPCSGGKGPGAGCYGDVLLCLVRLSEAGQPAHRASLHRCAGSRFGNPAGGLPVRCRPRRQ